MRATAHVRWAWICDVFDLFNYLPDFSADTTIPLSTFSEADSDSFITDPEKAHE